MRSKNIASSGLVADSPTLDGPSPAALPSHPDWRALRVRAGLTEDAMADRAGVDLACVQSFEAHEQPLWSHGVGGAFRGPRALALSHAQRGCLTTAYRALAGGAEARS